MHDTLLQQLQRAADLVFTTTLGFTAVVEFELLLAAVTTTFFDRKTVLLQQACDM